MDSVISNINKNTDKNIDRNRNRNAAWFGVLPVLLIVAFSAVVPLMTVVNYSVQDILDINTRFFVGFDWYRETLADPRLLGKGRRAGPDLRRRLGVARLVLH